LLRDYILTMEHKQLSVEDVLKAYWDDTPELKLLAIKDKVARKELRRREERIELAFNQLFLAEKAKMILPNNLGAVTFTELKEQAIERCKSLIKETEKLVARDEGGIMTRCWLANLEDYLESYKKTRVIRQSQLTSLIRHAYRVKGALICVGSQLAMEVWPTRIERRADRLFS